MSIEVEEKNNGFHVTWKTLKNLIFSSRKISETFKLNTASNVSFYVSFTHDLHINFLNFETVFIKLSVSLVKSSDDSPHDLPTSVWVKIDEGKRINLVEVDGSDEWTSGFGIKTFGNPTFHIMFDYEDNINTSSESIEVMQLSDAQQTLLVDDADSKKFVKNCCHGEKILLEQLEKMFVDQTYCDVQFLLDDEDKIGAHVSILSARSTVFSNLFNLQESDATMVVMTTVLIQDIRLPIFYEFLHHLYTGRTLAPLTDATAQPLFIVAKKYEIEDLKEKCVRYLLRNIRTKNAIDLLVWAELHSVEKIKEVTLDFVAANFKTICKSDEWENLMKKYPELGFVATRRFATV